MEVSSDDIAANGLVIAKYAMSMPNVVVDNGKCCMHQGHLAFMGATCPNGRLQPFARSRVRLQGVRQPAEVTARDDQGCQDREGLL